MSVVCYLQELETAFFDKDLQRCRASIHRILNELFECMYWGHYDLASCNFIDNVLIKLLAQTVKIADLKGG